MMEPVVALVVLIVVGAAFVVYKKKNWDPESRLEDPKPDFKPEPVAPSKPKAEKKPAPVKDNLDAMTKSELLELADKKGVKVAKSKPKSAMIAALRSQEK